MILTSFTQLRRFFAASGASLAQDGLPAYPGPMLNDGLGTIDNTGATGLLRANGFSGTLVARSFGGTTFTGGGLIGPLLNPSQLGSGDTCWPIEITCNGYAEDTHYQVHQYDWYLSARREVGRYPDQAGVELVGWTAAPFVVTMPDPGASGSIQIVPNYPAVGALLPGLSGPSLLTAEAWLTLFKHVAVYVSRRSDKAYAWAYLYDPMRM